jgi:hypothetical protein
VQGSTEAAAQDAAVWAVAVSAAAVLAPSLVAPPEDTAAMDIAGVAGLADIGAATGIAAGRGVQTVTRARPVVTQIGSDGPTPLVVTEAPAAPVPGGGKSCCRRTDPGGRTAEGGSVLVVAGAGGLAGRYVGAGWWRSRVMWVAVV